jgi:hypothetical protein
VPDTRPATGPAFLRSVLALWAVTTARDRISETYVKRMRMGVQDTACAPHYSCLRDLPPGSLTVPSELPPFSLGPEPFFLERRC